MATIAAAVETGRMSDRDPLRGTRDSPTSAERLGFAAPEPQPPAPPPGPVKAPLIPAGPRGDQPPDDFLRARLPRRR